MTEPTRVDRLVVPIAAIAAIALACVSLVLYLANPEADGAVFQGLASLLAVTPAALGWRIVALSRGNIVGRRLVWLGLASAWLSACSAVFEDGTLHRHATDAWLVRFAGTFGSYAFVLVFWTLAALIAVFPDGRPLTPRWGTWGRRYGAALTVASVGALFYPEDLTPDGRPELTVASLLPDGPAGFAWIRLFGVLVTFAGLIAVTVAVRKRFKRARGIERLQLSWLAYASVGLPVALGGCLVESLFFGGAGVVTFVLLSATLTAIPVAVAVAILRYRLYEIERLINRSLVYVTLTVALGAAYAAVALLVGVALGAGTGWATAVATFAVATAFRPARDHVQRAVDRRFAQRRYIGLRRVEAFLADVRAGRAEPERIGTVLSEALGDNGLEVFYRLPATGAYADERGRLAELPADDVRVRTPVRRGDLELGVVVHDPGLVLRTDTLDSVLRSAGLAMEIARLRVEVRVQLAEVEASKARIVAAAEAERRKLERDLHDGAQQRLVALGLALRHAQHQLGGDPDGALATIDGAVEEVAAAVGDLRRIARGLRPSLLDKGLAPALSAVARRAPLPVSVEISPATFPPDVEAAAFYLACEGLANAIKHAGAQHVRLRAALRDGVLELEVADDGVGGAVAEPGGGLAGMVARASERGGTLEVRSPPGGGTRLLIELPVAPVVVPA